MDENIEAIAIACSGEDRGVNELHLIRLRPYVESFLDPDWLSEELRCYEDWASESSDPTLQAGLLHRPIGMNMLPAAIWASRYWERMHEQDAKFRPPAGAKRLINIACSLAVLELNASGKLDAAAREYLRQRMQASDQVWGVIHECNTFAHFIRAGAPARPEFLKKGSDQEIVLQWKGSEIPVQCKAKLPGAGRVLSQQSFTTLAGCVARDAKLANQKLLVKIGSAGPIRDEDIPFLRDEVLVRLRPGVGPDLVQHRGRTFTIGTEQLAGQFTPSQAEQYLQSFGFYMTMIVGEPGSNGGDYEAQVVVGMQASPEEKPWNSLHESLLGRRGAVRQLEGGPPGIAAIHYADPVNDFESLRPRSEPMKVMIGQIVESHPHLAAVILTSEPDLQLPNASGQGRFVVYWGKEWRLPTDFPL